jgi:opacity protein-like surface antigen
VLLALAIVCVLVPAAEANDSRLGLHALYLEPSGYDTRRASNDAWGANLEVVLVPPGTWDAIAFHIGGDWMRIDSWKQTSIHRPSGLRIERETNQDLYRVFLGARLGHQGHGFLRPYASGSIALNVFNIDTDVVIPDDSAEDNDIRQDVESDSETAFGFDAGVGLEFNFSNRWYIDVGGKFIKTFDVPKQLGEDAEEIHPQYLQAYIGAGVTFSFLEEQE